MGNNYFGPSQTRKDKRKTKDFTYNYVDRIRLAEATLQDQDFPLRGSGWRQKSISHLDLATSCHSAASGLNYWPAQRHLRPSRSLDYNHISRCKEALDIAEYYWRIDPEEHYYEREKREGGKKTSSSGLRSSRCQYKDVALHYSDCADEVYHSTNNIYNSQQPKQQQQQQKHQHQQQQQHRQQEEDSHQRQLLLDSEQQQQQQIQPFDVGNDSCSLRRSRSLAVIREETFNDLQLTPTNSDRRRSQLIPRARLVNRGFFPEHENGLNCANNRPHQQPQHHSNISREKLTNDIEADEIQNIGSGVTICDPHTQQLLTRHQHQHRHHHHHHHNPPPAAHHHHRPQHQQPQSREADDYYDNLKRLDASASGTDGEHLHPWHNDKSDLESLNSDYFKNSLHQSHEGKQQQQTQQHQPHQQPEQRFSEVENESVKPATLCRNDKQRIYQSRRQQRPFVEKLFPSAAAAQHQTSTKTPPTNGGADSCPETSQSSVFPETTTSNSDDQSDSLSLSEQEYDLTKIEEIYQHAKLEQDEEEHFEVISLTTSTKTRIETAEEENYINIPPSSSSPPPPPSPSHVDVGSLRSHLDTQAYTKSAGTTLKRTRVLSENLEKLIAYDSVYLSSEDSSESTLIEEHHNRPTVENHLGHIVEPNGEGATRTKTKTTLLHISIEDTVFDSPLHSCGENTLEDDKSCEADDVKEETTTAQNTKQVTELVNAEIIQTTKIAICEQQPDQAQASREQTPLAEPILYTQILKVEHSTEADRVPAAPLPATTTTTTTAPIQPTSISSAANKPRIQATVEKRKLKRAADCLSTLTKDNLHPSQASACADGHSKNRGVITIKGNLIGNQFHSLPDVNIGKSLKVSERIDAKLRSSYDIKNCTSEEEFSDRRLRKSKGTQILLNHTPDCEVTSAEIYDSIQKFGKEHQKARLREYEDLHGETVFREEILGIREKRQCLEKGPKEVQFIGEEEIGQPKGSSKVKLNEVSEELSVSEANLAVEVSTDNKEILNDFDGTPCEDDCFVTDSSEYEEQPKELPSIEVPHFTREIERRAKEIHQIAAENQAKKQEAEKKASSGANQPKQQRQQQLSSESFTSATFRINKLTNNFPHSVSSPNTDEATASQKQFRIIVTDAQNNIIEEDSIESQQVESLSSLTTTTVRVSQTQTAGAGVVGVASGRVEEIQPNQTEEQVTRSRGKSTNISYNKSATSSLKRVPSKPKRTTIGCQHQQHQQHSGNQDKEPSSIQKAKDRRVLGPQIYKARPVKVLTSNESFKRAAIHSKMSRPQILHVVDNKRQVANGAAATGRASGNAITQALTPKREGSQVENEYMKKVVAVRCYWSKLAKNEREQEGEGEEGEEQEPQQEHNKLSLAEEKQCQMLDANKSIPHNDHQTNLQPTRDFHLKEHRHRHRHQPQQQEARAKNANELTIKRHTNDYCFVPSIEIVELEGKKTAAIVSAVSPHATTADTLSNEAKEPQFDHIRYKVMKSQQLLRSSALARTKKEAQFDGLIQYLQDYSFQELLANNNVVIVEPVRTKIERPLQTYPLASVGHSVLHGARDGNIASSAKPAQRREHHPPATKTPDEKTLTLNESSSQPNRTPDTASKQHTTIKRHFFYQPVRVNRELYEEELPNPDTVRNVRKFFEEHILPTPGRGITVQRCLVPKSGTHGDIIEYSQLSPRSRKVRKYRYLTIDTSYGQSAAPHGSTSQARQGARKWDSASLSSGISSGDLSSPCECIEAEDQLNEESNAGQQRQRLQQRTTPSTNQRPKDPRGVHVRDVIRLHNASSNEGKHVQGNGSCAGAIDNGQCRNTYEYNMGPCYGANMRRCRLRTDGGNDMSAEREGEDGDHQNVGDVDEEDNDDDDDDDDDEDDELNESYYVSNEVLEKIREYGSSVTYYGGRVLKRTYPEHNQQTFCHQSGKNNKASTLRVTLSSSTQRSPMTLTSVEAEDGEGCTTFRKTANKCPHPEHFKDKFQDVTTMEQKKGVTMITNTNNNDTYSGVKFKLIKSNSCSSRLELIGAAEGAEKAGQGVLAADTEIVRDMVKRLEATKGTELERSQRGVNVNRLSKSAPPYDNREAVLIGSNNLLTINNQMPNDPETSAEALKPFSDESPVTVNNHINVPFQAATLLLKKSKQRLHENTQPEERLGSKVSKDQKGMMVERKEKAKEYLAGGMAPSVVVATKGVSWGDDGNGHGHDNGASTAKICRNKNVDLAFTMSRQQQQQQQQQKLIKATKEYEEIATWQQSPPTISERDHSDKEALKSIKSHSITGTRRNEIYSSGIKKTVCENVPLECTNDNTNNNNNTKATTTEITSRITPTMSQKSITKSEHPKENGIKGDKPKFTNTAATKTATTNTVHTEIHKDTVPETTYSMETAEDKSGTAAATTTALAASSAAAAINLTASSSSCSMEKNFVRYYVANDKRLFERRKYDDIEFEEFEVYDPSKEVERLASKGVVNVGEAVSTGKPQDINH